MGLRHTVRAFRCADLETFRKGIEQAALRENAKFKTERNPILDEQLLNLAQGKCTISADYDYPCNAVQFFRNVSIALDSTPWIEIRIQEGSHWDYTLNRGQQQIDQFSTLPQYWNGNDPLMKLHYSGRAEMLSVAFDVPIQRIENYIKHWYTEYDPDEDLYVGKLEGKAYAEDKYTYDDYSQFWDFLNALGVIDPTAVPIENRIAWVLDLPKPAHWPKTGWKRWFSWLRC